jgi:hypothetical protein
MRQWTPEERHRQATLMRGWKPWQSSLPGNKTPEGKARSSRNALKHGAYSAEVKAMRKYLKEARRRLKALGF